LIPVTLERTQDTMKSTIEFNRTSARTVTVIFEAPLDASLEFPIEGYEVERFDKKSEREVEDLLSDFRVDVERKLVSNGVVEMTDDVDEKVDVTYNGIYARKDVIVFRYAATITFSHDMPDLSAAIADVKKWLASR